MEFINGLDTMTNEELKLWADEYIEEYEKEHGPLEYDELLDFEGMEDIEIDFD